MKKIKLLLVFISLFACSTVFALVKPTDKFYVNDYANVIDDETEEYIFSKAKELDFKTNAQVVVVTVPNLEGMDLETYANKLFNEFGIGDKDENNGLLILLALEERLSRIEVGYGLEEFLTDGKTGRFQDTYMIPDYKENNFNDGLKKGFDAFVNEIAAYYEVEINVDTKIVDINNSTTDEFSVSDIIIIIGFIIFLIIIIILGLSETSGYSGGGSSFGGGHSSGGGGFSGGGGHSGGGGSSRSF